MGCSWYSGLRGWVSLSLNLEFSNFYCAIKIPGFRVLNAGGGIELRGAERFGSRDVFRYVRVLFFGRMM